MRSFLVVSGSIGPILLTVVALRYVSGASRRYVHAERELIIALQRASEGESYATLAQAKEVTKDFLTDVNSDIRLLAAAVTTITDVANRELQYKAAQIIVRIMRHGSDLNRANYLEKLLDEIDLNPRPRPERSSPDPNKPPSSLSIVLPRARRRHI